MNDREQMLKGVKQRYNIAGNCDALNRAIELAVKVARVDLSVLVLGENGSGKEVMPRIIHDASARKGKKYFALNCGAIPEGTIDSELFGHVEGAFTGSVGKREGYFAAADGGTLFLDEVGELPLQTQVRLLRVLETGEYIPVGASEPRRTNVRIVAATNVDMKRAIREGRFREDLFYRLSAVTINIPPLRERGNDIDMLFRMFALENQRKHNIPPIRLNDDARKMLLRYTWPGNVRQLKNVVDSMSILCEEREIDSDTLALFIPVDGQHTQMAPIVSANVTSSEHGESNEQIKSLFLAVGRLAQDVKELKSEVAMLKEKLDTKRIGPSRNEAYANAEYFFEERKNEKPQHDLSEFEYEEIIAEEAQSAEMHKDPNTPRTLQEVEEHQIREALIRNAGNRRKTAKELNLSERTLYRKIKEYGISK